MIVLFNYNILCIFLNVGVPKQNVIYIQSCIILKQKKRGNVPILKVFVISLNLYKLYSW